MDDLREKSRSGRNWLEQILVSIPGFRGYLEKEYRREADHLLRQHLAAGLATAKQRLNEVMRGLTDTGRLAWLGRLTPAVNLLEKLEGRIRFASHGYTGFFDAAKIGTAELDQLYAFDAALLREVEELTGQTAALSGQTTDATVFGAAVEQLLERLRALDAHLNERDEAVRGLRSL
jgi:hypothetical protein